VPRVFNVVNRRLIRVGLVAAIGLLVARIASADERAPRKALTELHRVLSWFPKDTETLVAAQSFSVQSSPIPRITDKESESESSNVMPSLATGELYGSDFDQYLEPFVGRKILIALKGMRRPRPVGSLGAFYAEGCSVVVFEHDLGQAAVEWTDALRKGAKEVRKIAGREVFCLTPRENIARRHPSVYFVRLAPDTLLSATHDGYLQELLNRIDTPQRDRAFPDSSPLWASVDRSATVWMIREIPGHSLRIIEGVTWTWANGRARVVYLPRGSAAEKVLDQARRLWEGRISDDGPGAFKFISESLRKAVHVELGQESRVTVSFKTEGQEDTVRFILFLGLYVSQVEDGNVGPQ
jgi:hypothetical protein